MINNIEHFIEKKYGKGKRRRFAMDLWPDLKSESNNDKIALNGKVKGLIDSDPRTLKYDLLDKITKLLDLTKMQELWLPLENDK
jgi:hypothetical protein